MPLWQGTKKIKHTSYGQKKGKYVTLPRYHAWASFFIAEQVRRINQYTKFTKIPLQI